MKVYEVATRYNQMTGKPYQVKVFKEIRCDYTGEVIEFEEHGCDYHLDYEDRDPCFGAGDEEYAFANKYMIDAFVFLSEPYHFRAEGGGSDLAYSAEAIMMREVISKCKDKSSPWYNCYTFDAICRAARIATATRLLEEKVLVPEQLMED